MPRRAKTSRKKRTRVRRALKRGRRKYKSSLRRRKYNVRRLYRRRKFRLRTSRAYRQQSKVGLKFSLNLSLMDFLLFPWYDLRNLLANQIDRVTPNLQPIFIHANGQVHGDEQLNPQNRQSMLQYFRAMFTIMSTSLYNAQMKLPVNRQYLTARKRCSAFAFNPPLSHTILGPLFNSYVNMYNQFKYVGLKVRWIPAKSSFNSTVCKTTTSTTSTTTVPTENFEPYYQNQIMTRLERPQHTETTASTSTTLPVTDMVASTLQPLPSEYDADPFMKSHNPTTYSCPVPQYRLWVNFEKTQFSPLPWAFFPTGSTEQQWNDWVQALGGRGPRTWAEYNQGMITSRFKYRSCFDTSSGDPYEMLLPHQTTRSYSLLKPFKFFVRPYNVDFAEENSEGQPMNASINYNINYLEKNYTVPYGDYIVKGMRKMGYQQMPHFYPENYFLPTQPDFESINTPTAIDNNYTKLIMNFNDKNFFNPVLFSYFVTRDDLPIDEYDNQLYVRHYDIAHTAPLDASYLTRAYEYSDFIGTSNFNNLGRFKLTFYVRFKGRKSNYHLVSLPLDTTNSGMNQRVEFPIPYTSQDLITNNQADGDQDLN